MPTELGGPSAPDGEVGVPEQVEAALPWIEAHCRFVISKLPRRGIGVQLAEDLLNSVPEAVARCVPDLRGTTPEFLEVAAAYGLLAKVPSRRAGREMLKLLAELTPMFELRGNQFWVQWIVHLTDPEMLAQLKRATPRSQLLARPLSSAELRPSSLQLSTALAAAEAELADERAANAELHVQLVELKAALAKRASQRRHDARQPAKKNETDAPGRQALESELALHRQQVANLAANAMTLKSRIAELEVELESTRSRCLTAYEGVGALEREKQELARRLKEAQERQRQQSQTQAKGTDWYEQRLETLGEELSTKRDELARISSQLSLARKEANTERQARVDAERRLKELMRGKTPRESAPEEQVATSQRSHLRVVQTSRKVGRNEPCPCGSGRKYKHCCGR